SHQGALVRGHDLRPPEPAGLGLEAEPAEARVEDRRRGERGEMGQAAVGVGERRQRPQRGDEPPTELEPDRDRREPVGVQGDRALMGRPDEERGLQAMSGLAVFHLVAGATLTGLAVHACLNHLLGQRLDRMAATPSPPRLSVLIPARNEAGRIGRCVEHWAAQEYPDYEVFVYDDDSSDDTAARAQAAAAGSAQVRVIRGGPLPEGWRGKPFACHRLRAHARGEILVFADADVTPSSLALARTAGAFHALGADLVSAVPAHWSPSAAVRALVALQNWAALAFVPAWLPAGRGRRVWTAVNGQFLAIRADAYDEAGGFAGVRGSVAGDGA